MITAIIVVTIVNTFFFPLFSFKNELPLDTSEDILSEGISDPEWITKGY
jgi:hypothetical protein